VVRLTAVDFEMIAQCKLQYLAWSTAPETVFSCPLYKQNADMEHMILQKAYFAQQLMLVLYLI